MKPADFSKINEIRREISRGPLETLSTIKLELWTIPTDQKTIRSVILQLEDHLNYPT